jgi:hypothetical protein
MADKTPETWTLEDIRQREKEIVEAKQARIQDLLEQRKGIDAELAELGYSDGQKPHKEVKKRHRRTKEEIAAARAGGEK